MSDFWRSKFMITLASDGISLLKPLSDLVCAEPSRVTFQPYTSIAGKNGLGHVLRIGFPVANWEWDWLPQTDIDILLGYEAQNVFIQTEVHTGVIRQFLIFSCYLQPLLLSDYNRKVSWYALNGARQKRPVRMEFAQLVETQIGVSSFSV